MALKINSAPQSFIRFGAEVNSACYSCDPNFCILMADGDVFAFQFKISGTNTELDAITSSGGFAVETWLQNQLSDVVVSAPSSFYWLYNRTTEGESYVIVRCNVTVPLGLNSDKKYRIILRVEKGSTLLEESSNCITYISETCYTSFLKYRNNEDAFGFIYCLSEDFYNSVRLPFHLTKAQFQDEEEVYYRSDGDAIMLSSINRKEFTLVTDYMPEWAHEALKLALSHDFVEVNSDDYTGDIRKSGGYEIQWIEFVGVKSGNASVNVNAVPFDEKNTACEDCEDCDEILNLPEDILYTYPDVVVAGQTVSINIRTVFEITDLCGPIINALPGFSINSDYIESVVLEDEILQIKIKDEIPDPIFLEDAITDIVLRCGCGIISIGSINFNFNNCDEITYELGAEKISTNCDGDLGVGRDIDVTGPVGEEVTVRIKLLYDGSLINMGTHTGTVPFSVSKDDLLIQDLNPEFDEERLFYQIVFEYGECSLELEPVNISTCSCPSEEYLLSQIEWSFTYHDEETREYISGVNVNLLSNIFDLYPLIGSVEIRAEGFAGTIVNASAPGSEDYGATYTELEEVSDGAVYFVVICCPETDYMCETIIQLTPTTPE